MEGCGCGALLGDAARGLVLAYMGPEEKDTMEGRGGGTQT